MQTKITLILSILSISLCSGQKLNTLRIASPFGIAGDYKLVRANFGSQKNDEISAKADFVNDGVDVTTDACQNIVNDMVGKIAFIDRGVCSFASKASKAQLVGAIAVIICNNAANANQAPFIMTEFAENVTVPSFMMSYYDCQKMRIDIISQQGTFNATILNTCHFSGQYPSSTVWGQKPKQGDFEGGLNDWTVSSNNSWTYMPEGTMTGNAFGNQDIVAWSGCNGSVGFLSDYLDNGGDPDKMGQGPCPAICQGSLYSPAINLSSFSIDGIYVEFSQLTRQYQSKYWLLTSKDNGIKWDSFPLNQDLLLNSFIVQNRVRVPLPNYDNVASIKLQFYYEGNYYYWAIDDVIVVNEKYADGEIKKLTASAAPSFVVPSSQVSAMALMTDVSSLGNATLTNANIAFEVHDSSNPNQNVYNKSLNIMDLESNATKTFLFPSTFTPPSVPGNYVGSYRLSSIVDKVSQNDTAKFEFYVSENYFSKTPIETDIKKMRSMRFVGIIFEEPDVFTVSNVYYVPKGKGLTFDSLVFGAVEYGPTSDKHFFEATIYEWNDINNDNIATENEREKIGGNIITLQGTDRRISVPVGAANSDGTYDLDTQFELKDNSDYICAIHYYHQSIGRNYDLLGHYSDPRDLNNQLEFNYSNQEKAQDMIPSLIKRYPGSLFGFPYSEDQFHKAEFGREPMANTNYTPFIDAYVGTFVGRVVSTDTTLSETKVTLSQNPVQNDLIFDVQLAESATINIVLINSQGKGVYNILKPSFKEGKITIPVDTFTSGMYTLRVSLDNGEVIDREFVILN